MYRNDRLSLGITTAPSASRSTDSQKEIRSKRFASRLTITAGTVTLFAALTPAFAQEAVQNQPSPDYAALTGQKRPAVMPGIVITPASTQFTPADRGKRAHTNVHFIIPSTASPDELPPYNGLLYETPASLACIYHVVTPIAGCNPNSTITNPAGGSQTIAIVDAFDDPEAAADLAYFSDQFGLPFSPEKFSVVYQTPSTPPPTDPSGGWELEESLDIEYAHAMAPNATIYLVEANSNYYTDLFAAVTIASNLVLCGKTTTCPTTSTGKGEVSMSWGGGEFPAETTWDSYLKGKNVVYFASSGDSAGTLYPCVSPNVVCAGGTSTARSLVTGNLIEEIAWSDAGGGISLYELRPSYQAAISGIVGKYRGAPDLSSDANPNTGVWIYDSFPYGGYYYTWFIVGGTSVASPTLAGIVNAAGHFAASSNAELTTIYANRAVAADFNDITYGACGYYSGTFSGTGYDLCTGVGSPHGLTAK